MKYTYIKDFEIFSDKISKEAFPKAIFIGGEEYYLKREAVILLRNTIPDTKIYFADELNGDNISNMFSPNLFAKKAVPIIYNSDVFADKKKIPLFQTIISKIQKQKDNGISVIFVFRTPEEAGAKKIYAFPRDVRKFIPKNIDFSYWAVMFWNIHTKEDRLKMGRWIQKLFNKAGYNITDDAKEYLMDIHNMNYSYINNEIGKIISYHPEETLISLKMVKSIGGDFRENVGYNLPISIVKGDIKEALLLLKNALLYKGKDESLTKNLFDFFKKLYILKMYQNTGENLYGVMKEILHIPFYMKNTYVSILNLVTIDFLKDALLIIAQREKEIKIGISKEEWLYTLITFLTERRRQYV